MRKKFFCLQQGMRMGRVGLFLGTMCVLAGCIKPISAPGTTLTPEPVATCTAEVTPEQETATPVPQVTEPVTQGAIAPTEEPEVLPTPTPEPLPTPVPTATPEPEPTPTPVPTPIPISTPEPTPAPTMNPEAEVTPEPTMTPEVTSEPTPTPEPTGRPEYDTLLQNGWQRTGDFFGRREIFFSGMFDKTELIAEPGRYEYRYLASGDDAVSFYIIGEEMPAQQFLDELLLQQDDCLIEQEGTDDFSYVYVEGDVRVRGRVYSCTEGETERRMRIEFFGPAFAETQTEGYEFYLR